MFCTNCGNQLSDDALFCPNCGARVAAASGPQVPPEQQPAAPQPATPQPLWQQEPQPQQPQQTWQQPQQAAPAYQEPYYGAAVPVAAKKRSGKKGLLIGLGCVALAALVGGGIWFLSRMNKAENKLLQAAKNSLTALEDYTASLPNLHSVAENLERLSDQQALRFRMDMSSEYAYNYDGSTMSSGVRVNLDLNLDQKNKRARLSGSLDPDGLQSLGLELYGDEEQLQFASPALLEEGEVLTLPIRDLAKQWNASALASLTEITLPENLDLSADPDTDFDKALTDAYGEDWTKLRDSFEVIEYEGTPHFSDAGITYTLTWDRDTLKKMYEKTDADFQDLADIEDIEDLAELDFHQLGAQLIVSGLGLLNEQVQDMQFLVTNDKLTALYLEATNEYDESSKVELRLMGENNLWEHLRYTGVTDYSSYTVTETADITMTKIDGQLRIAYEFSHEDSDGAEYGYTEGPYTLIYNDADGRILYEDEDGDRYEEPAVYLTPAEGGLGLLVEQAVENSYYSQSSKYDFTLSGKLEDIAPLSGKTVELLKLSEQELRELAERIQKKILSSLS